MPLMIASPVRSSKIRAVCPAFSGQTDHRVTYGAAGYQSNVVSVLEGWSETYLFTPIPSATLGEG